MKKEHLYERLSRKGFEPSHVAEVGVYLPETCNVLDYLLLGVRGTLVEANPRIVERLQAYFRGRNNVTIHPVAVYDRAGQLELFDREASTFAGMLEASPAIVNDAYEVASADRFVVPAVTFDSIDDGSIDLLSVDVEGCEWFVLKHMRSRPQVICVETHGARYVNPYLAEIVTWMRQHDYAVWYRDKSDSVFVRRGALDIGLADRARLLGMNLRIALRRLRKSAGRP